MGGERSLGVLKLELPAVCDVSITNLCNAVCEFCGFARDKTLAGAARYISADAFAQALPILHRRGIRYMTLQGGEPLVHPDIVRLVSETVAAGISCAVITNGWFLPRYIERLAAAGLDRLIISMDSADITEHERNRGLEGLERRIAEGIARAHAYGLPVQASVTISRLVRSMNCRPCCAGLGSTRSRFPTRGASRSAPPPWFTGIRTLSTSTVTNCLLRSMRSAV